MENLNVPVGVSDFAEIRQNGYYYIDKSGLISDLLKTTGTKVTLITRPRRFGKTMAMSMLENFFDIRKDSRKLFAGLEVAQNEELCQEWLNKWPTIFISFKSIDGLSFESAYGMLSMLIAELFNKHLYLLDSDKYTAFEKEKFQMLACRNASYEDAKHSIALLINMLYTYYNKPVIILIDEYDVPIAKAIANGYYKEMLEVMNFCRY